MPGTISVYAEATRAVRGCIFVEGPESLQSTSLGLPIHAVAGWKPPHAGHACQAAPLSVRAGASRRLPQVDQYITGWRGSSPQGKFAKVVTVAMLGFRASARRLRRHSVLSASPPGGVFPHH
jgi:hypothetical protein